MEISTTRSFISTKSKQNSLRGKGYINAGTPPPALGGGPRGPCAARSTMHQAGSHEAAALLYRVTRCDGAWTAQGGKAGILAVVGDVLFPFLGFRSSHIQRPGSEYNGLRIRGLSLIVTTLREAVTGNLPFTNPALSPWPASLGCNPSAFQG